MVMTMTPFWRFMYTLDNQILLTLCHGKYIFVLFACLSLSFSVFFFSFLFFFFSFCSCCWFAVVEAFLYLLESLFGFCFRLFVVFIGFREGVLCFLEFFALFCFCWLFCFCFYFLKCISSECFDGLKHNLIIST